MAEDSGTGTPVAGGGTLTAGRVLAMARRLLADDLAGDGAAASERWSDPALFSYLNEAVRELIKSRPDLLLQNDGTMGTVVALALELDETPVSEEWRGWLADYVMLRCLEEEGSESEHFKRAQALRALLEKRAG